MQPKADLLIVKSDCIRALKALEDDRVSLTISDPPYQSLERHRAVGTTTRLKESKASSNPWFEVFKNTRYFSLFDELYRVHCKNTHCYIFCDSETEHVILSGRNPYDKKLDDELLAVRFEGTDTDREGEPKGLWRAWPPLLWIKTKQEDIELEKVSEQHLQLGMGYHWRRCEERLLFLEKGKRKLNNLGWPNVLFGSRAGKNDPPTKKPDGVITRLILNSSSVGDVVLDPFAGSGIVGRVALRHGRRAILIDINLDNMRWKEWPEVLNKYVEQVG